ncbi:DUF308 domain-containing protein [uncultured Bacteroides sp.]|uniref:HdeD family acid-resistance protein n=1 Tax=uncultured Bacteroides sp. TaxID=162156 RepID=UPI002625553E|nr:DUF308 domain-containing protein [uncultured Bacteroides sp.]
MLDSIIRLERKDIRYWWISLIVGLFSIAAGIGCFVTPGGSLALLTVLFVTTLLAGGILNILFATLNRKRIAYWSWSLARGIIEVLLGIWLILLPLPVVTTGLIFLVGFWMLFHSIIGIGESCELQQYDIKGWGWLLACNILSLIFSFVYLMSPVFGGLFVVFYLGFSFVFYGVFRFVLAFKLRRFNQEVRKMMEEEKSRETDDGIEDAVIIE